jgi:hypothetical protein
LQELFSLSLMGLGSALTHEKSPLFHPGARGEPGMKFTSLCRNQAVENQFRGPAVPGRIIPALRPYFLLIFIPGMSNFVASVEIIRQYHV